MDKPTAGTKFVFAQDGDCTHDSSGDLQELTVEVCDGGGGVYLAISTERWALDSEDLKKFIRQLKWCMKQVRSVGI